jgi:hypothetical protein
MFGGAGKFRPWGRFDQVMRSQRGREWALIACSSPELRCTTAFGSMRALNMTGSQLIFEIEDPLSVATQEIARKTSENWSAINAFGFADQTIVRLNLTEPFRKYEIALRGFLTSIGDKDLIVDITSLPKKVYFFLMKLLFQEFPLPRNIIVTYAEPDRYSNQPLAENPDPWEALPGFRISPRDENDRSIVVGIGYEPLGLPDLADSGKFDEDQMIFLFPFPSQADRVLRNWRFIRGIFPNADSGRLNIKSLDSSLKRDS